MIGLKDVVQAWRQADPKHIHPTREHVSEQAYWDSGRPQAELILDLLPDLGTVLDFGCGDGRIAIPLSKLGFEVWAMDAAPEMIERLRDQAEAQGAEGIHSVIADGSTLFPLSLDFFDAINARAVFIHHSHTDVIKMVRNLAKLIKPGGFLIADWPIGKHHERRDWIDVTTWEKDHRDKVAESVGLELVSEGVPTLSPSVWRKQ
jgi:2-polyprenyl-3-methyl-5-hydroxy-6-metoxy-1,4-benzoquinol methylase